MIDIVNSGTQLCGDCPVESRSGRPDLDLTSSFLTFATRSLTSPMRRNLCPWSFPLSRSPLQLAPAIADHANLLLRHSTWLVANTRSGVEHCMCICQTTPAARQRCRSPWPNLSRDSLLLSDRVFYASRFQIPVRSAMAFRKRSRKHARAMGCEVSRNYSDCENNRIMSRM